MKLKAFLATTTLAAGLSSTAMGAADHLLISEILANSPGTESDVTSAEFIEIYNPTQTTIDLSYYYLTDYVTYYQYPADNFPWVDTADYLLQFPSGTQLLPGQVAVVTQDATNFFAAPFAAAFGSNATGYFAQAGSPLLFEIAETDNAVPQIINPKGGQAKDISFAKTNGGEYASIIFWDGVTDLVSDVDSIRYGTVSAGNQPVNKGGLEVDGPDADETSSTYKTDALAPQFNIAVAEGFERVTTDEPGETLINGNGITGHDETSEDLDAAFDGIANSASTPGLPHANLPKARVETWSIY